MKIVCVILFYLHVWTVGMEFAKNINIKKKKRHDAFVGTLDASFPTPQNTPPNSRPTRMWQSTRSCAKY